MNPFLTCSSAPHRLHRSSIASLRRTYHRRRIWAIYARLKPCDREHGDIGKCIISEGYLYIAHVTPPFDALHAGIRAIWLPPSPAATVLVERSAVKRKVRSLGRRGRSTPCPTTMTWAEPTVGGAGRLDK